MFQLDKQLEMDTILIKEQEKYLVLLNKIATCPWLILVSKTNQIEFYKLEFDFFLNN